MKISQDQLRNAALFIIILAILLRIIGLAHANSFFLDELNLARNLAEKPYWQLLFPLDYQQYAPPLFCQLSKFSAELVGYTELGLRLVPFLFGIGSIVLFYDLLKRFFNPTILLYPLLLFSFNTYLYRHGIELKQYSVDVFLTIFWIWLAINTKDIDWKIFLKLTALGILSVWLSMPVVFILFGIGVYFFTKRTSSNLPKYYVVGMCFLWLLSFGLLFYINLQHGIKVKGLQTFHDEYFLAFPSSLENIEQSWKLIVGIFRAIVGKTALAIGWLFLCFFIGIYQIWQQQRRLLILFPLPILACFGASILHYYSLIIRLSLFLFPIIIIISGFGLVFIIEKSKHKVLLGIIFCLLIFSLLHRTALPHFWSEYVRENPKTVLQQLSVIAENKLPLYVTAGGSPGYQFYTTLYENPIEIAPSKLFYGHWNDDLTQLASAWKGRGITHIWIFDSHTFGAPKQRLESQIQEMGKIEQELSAKAAHAYLLRLE